MHSPAQPESEHKLEPAARTPPPYPCPPPGLPGGRQVSPAEMDVRYHFRWQLYWLFHDINERWIIDEALLTAELEELQRMSGRIQHLRRRANPPAPPPRPDLRRKQKERGK